MKTNALLPKHDRPTGLRKAWWMLAQFVWIVAGVVVLTAVVALTVSLLAGLLKPGL